MLPGNCGRSEATIQLLSWVHYRALMQVNDKAARDWYASAIEAGKQRATLYSALEIAEAFGLKIAEVFFLVEVPDEE